MPLPQDTQGVGVVERDPSFVAVQAHPQPGREGSGVRVGHASLAVAVAVARGEGVSFREEDLPRAHREEAERRGVLAVLGPAVMAAVWITAGGDKNIRLNKGQTTKNVGQFPKIKQGFQICSLFIDNAVSICLIST